MNLVVFTSFGVLAQIAAPVAGPPAPPSPATNVSATPPAAPASVPCTTPVDPYKNFNCMDTYLGDNVFQRLFNNPDPNYLYPSSTFKTDPGAMPSVTACVRVDWNEGHDNFYPCADAINTGTWGYNKAGTNQLAF